jgi:hypothetical protein
MSEISQLVLEVIRKDKAIAWIADELSASYSEGIAQSAKERPVSLQALSLTETDLITRERSKREKYETSRPYSEAEKLELVDFGLRQVFVAIPAMQDSIFKTLSKLGCNASRIEFVAPDEERVGLEHSFTASPKSADELAQNVANFLKVLRK